jgi:hypothetical protein
VNWPGSVNSNHVRDHRCKCSYASKGIQLYKTKIGLLQQKPEQESSGTNPYSPSVGAMSSDDTPLIIEVNDEFPSGKRGLSPGKGGGLE